MEQTETIFASAAEAEGGGAAAAPEAGGWTLHCQHGKNKHSVVIDPALTVLNLKERLQEVTGVPTGLMKLMTKFMLKDADVISSTKLKDKAKVKVVGNPLLDILAATTAPKPAEGAKELVDDSEMTEAPDEPLHTQERHKKILAMGPLEGSPPGRTDGAHEPIPDGGVHKLRTGPAGKEARLAFKFEGGMSQLMIQTKVSPAACAWATLSRLSLTLPHLPTRVASNAHEIAPGLHPTAVVQPQQCARRAPRGADRGASGLLHHVAAGGP